MVGGPRGGTTPPIRTLQGLQLEIGILSHSHMTVQHRKVSPGHEHWRRPLHKHRLQRPPHSCS